MLLLQKNPFTGRNRTFKQASVKSLAPVPVKGRGVAFSSKGQSLEEVVLNASSRSRRPCLHAVQQSYSGSCNRGGPAASSNQRVKIAVDVDEVLGRFVYTLNKYCKDHFDMNYKVEDYWVYEFAKIWICSQEHSNHVVHEFFKSQHFNDGIPVIPGALEALQRLKEKYCLVVVTSRQHIIQDVTMEWLDRHFGGLFEVVYFGNHFALEGVSRKKSDICKAIGAEILIDDNPSYAIECAAAGINVLLYDWEGSYPWSKLPPGKEHDLISVVKNWDEVEAAIAGITQERLLTPVAAATKASC